MIFVLDTRRSAMNWKWQMDSSMRSLTRWQRTRKKLLPSGRNRSSKEVSAYHLYKCNRDHVMTKMFMP